MAEMDQTARICPEAYDHVDTRDLVEPPSNKMVLIGIVFLCFMLAVVVSYVWLYRTASRNIEASLQSVVAQDRAPAK